MQFIIQAYDGTDSGATERRMAYRDAHLKLIASLKESGNALMGAAILDDAGTMIGSTLIMEYPSRAALDAWLAEEPYVTGKVWQTITVTPCRVAAHFLCSAGEKAA
ncbi:MAG: hypothetical protein IT567_07385 [Alphaproteobacteria bacterium]|nr:hypothetical protein [Alphaproteobacteria bacterium]